MKILAFAFVFLANICFAFTVAKGLIVASGQRLSTYWNEDLVDHQVLANWAFWTLMATVVAIEVMVQLKGRHVHDGRFVFHICVAFIALVTLYLLRRKYTGLSHPRVHTVLAIACFLSFVAMDATGIPLLQKF